MPRVAGSCTRGVDRAAPPGAGPAAASMTALPLAWPVLGSRPSLCTIDDKGASWCAAQKLGCNRDFVQVRCESTCKQSLQQTHLRKLPPCEALNTSDASTFLEVLAPVYATDPSYSSRLERLIEDYRLDRWDDLVLEARAARGEGSAI